MTKGEGMSAKARKSSKDSATTRDPAPKLVYTQAPVLLARLVERSELGWKVDLGTMTRDLPVDASVDPRLLEDAAVRGARVLVDASATPIIVGVIATQRALVVDEEDRVHADVASFRVDAREEVLLKTPGAFVRAKAREVEVYGDRVITKARDLAKILAAMIKLN